MAVKAPVMKIVCGVAAAHLGHSENAADNLALRKRVQLQPGAPHGGCGFFNPRLNAGEAGDSAPPEHLDAQTLRGIKLDQFARCAAGAEGLYYLGLQPIYDAQGKAIAAEILVRARNGSHSAPFEDVKAIADPAAPKDVREVYVGWKAFEMVDWPVAALKDYPVLQSLRAISSNVRPLDLSPRHGLLAEVERRLYELAPNDRALLLKYMVLEVTEDQAEPEDLSASLDAWRALGFRFSYDDTIGELACQALSKRGENFHTTSALARHLGHFFAVKVDIEWAGLALFLSHPAYNSRAAVKEEVLRHARDEDLVYVPQGPGLRSTGVRHSTLLAEFAKWCREMIEAGKHIYVELSVSREDESNRFALEQLKTLGLDMFGEHQAHFCFQGGPTGARAFEPRVLAPGAVAAL